MKTYCIANTKGGVGKTTIAVHLATFFASKGKTLLIDGDPQKSSADWATWRRDNEGDKLNTPTTICLTGKAILDEGKELAKSYDYIVVDVGGRDSSSLRNALLFAEFAIIPAGASNLDAAAMSDLIDAAKDFNSKLKTKILLSRIDLRTKDIDSMIEYLKNERFDFFDTQVSERVAFRRSVGAGLTVCEVEPDGAACKEINQFYNEVISL